LTAPVLPIRDLRVEFATHRGALTAVDGVSLAIAPGEVLGLVGESGAGKSALGAALIDLIDPPGRITGGAVFLSGRRIDDLPPKAMRRIRGRRIGWIPQDTLASLDPLARIGAQLVETIRAHADLSRAAARRRAVERLAEVGVPAPERRIDAYPHELSGGLRQRAVIALALCAEPDLLIADEPTAALDVVAQARVLAMVRRLVRDRGLAVLLITHDMGVVAQTADRVAVLYAGRMVESGPARDVLRNPRHPYTRNLLDAVPTLAGHNGPLAAIPGAAPGFGAAPSGCPFHSRCPLAFALCRAERPQPASDGARTVACHLRGR
jgi:peptide/nickel transport system ATP-binding protein